MKKIKATVLFIFCLMMLCVSNAVFAAGSGDKIVDATINPVWIHLRDQKVPSNHNPNGTLVSYGMDKASAKIHSSNKDFGFWLAKITKAKNEIELTYIRIAKNKSYYKEVTRQVYYLDGTFKSAENMSGSPKPLSSAEAFYNAPEVFKDETVTVSNMNVPQLPEGFNRLELKTARHGYENWNCFVDDRSTGRDSKESKILTLVTYAFNPADRVYVKGVTYCERTDSNSYAITGGDSYLYTYEDKLLSERSGKKSYFISDQEADSIVRYKYEMHK